MRIIKQTKDGVVEFTITGAMLDGSVTEKLIKKLKDSLADGIKKVIIELTGVYLVNGVGINTLKSCVTLSNKKIARLIFLNPPEEIERKLIKTKPNGSFKICHNKDEALRLFKNDWI